MRFVDLPAQARLDIRRKLSSINVSIINYSGNGIMVTLPRGNFAATQESIRDLGLEPGDMHYFPLGTDKVPEIMRHDGRYPGSRGFHLYQYVTLR